jgi:hypothetical protein
MSNVNDIYGFDAFCQELIQNWPTISLSFRRKDNDLFVTASSLGILSTAIGRDGELAGTTVRRAVTDLHARLVVAGPRAQLREVAREDEEDQSLTIEESAVLETVLELRSLRKDLLAAMEEYQDASDSALNCGDTGLMDLRLESVESALSHIRETLADISDLEKTLDDLDPDGEIEADLESRGHC